MSVLLDLWLFCGAQVIQVSIGCSWPPDLENSLGKQASPETQQHKSKFAAFRGAGRDNGVICALNIITPRDTTEINILLACRFRHKSRANERQRTAFLCKLTLSYHTEISDNSSDYSRSFISVCDAAEPFLSVISHMTFRAHVICSKNNFAV